jgi:tRNA pseudouridine55 synthase
MDGYLLVDKPKGWTSFDVVAKVRGLVRAANRQAMADGSAQRQLAKRVKVGHTGTLDPLATGLLVVLVGSYTKRATELTKLDKTYEVAMVFGQSSTTGDAEGDISAVSGARPTTEQLQLALNGFVGDIMQVPPAYSAMKVNGVRAYKLAREGKVVELEARPARINAVTLTGYDYPLATFTADVSSGTYIRSLVEDIGRVLGTGAYMSDLRRTRVGSFRLDGAVSTDELPAVLRQRLQTL